MSRIGKMPIPLPPEVEVRIGPDNTVTVKGPKGELTKAFHPSLRIERRDGELVVGRPSDSRLHRSLHGLTRSLLANMVAGVTRGFERVLELSGVGYRVQKQENKLILQLGFSHPVEIVPPPGAQVTSVETFTPTSANNWLSARFRLWGVDKEQVGKLASEIRRLRRAEPYKGKGIKYGGEALRRKAGKAGKAGKK